MTGNKALVVAAMPSNRYRGPPMPLANMRAQGVRSLWVVCELCHHDAVLNVDRFGDQVPVPWFGPHGVHLLRHRRCGCTAELAGAADGGEPDWAAVALLGCIIGESGKLAHGHERLRMHCLQESFVAQRRREVSVMWQH